MNCWEYKNCRKEVFEICPAYPEIGSACYMVTGVKCGEGKMEFASLDEQVAHCGKCDFYAHQRSRIKHSIGSMNETVRPTRSKEVEDT
ncbi:MAG TPA: hypothetical protein VL122_09865 [Nitrospirota bacterium]|nr:hypothetical protein [Nitrospirota bacterium]